MDLFTPIVPNSKLHPNFVSAIHPFAAGPRAVLASWAADFPDRDGKFVKEFQTTFNSSFWELYLHAAFRQLGFAVDYGHHAPDFTIGGAAPFCAEAVVTNEAQGFAPEWTLDVEDLERLEAEREDRIRYASIRLSNAIGEKARKYRDSYVKLPHVEKKPYIICVAPFEQPAAFDLRDHALLRVLYGFDRVITAREEDRPVVLAESWIAESLKDNGATVSLGLFSRAQLPEVSAVLFSTTATFGKLRALDPGRTDDTMFFAVRFNEAGTHPHEIRARGGAYTESLLDGLGLYLNPYAATPIDVGPFLDREINITAFEAATRRFLIHMPDRFLFSRSTHTIVSHGGLDDIKGVRPSSRTYKQPRRHSWPDGEPHPVESDDLLFDHHTLAHYQGWTIHIGRDREDHEWVGRAVESICFSTGEVATAGQKPDVSDLLTPRSHESMEIALFATIAAIKEHEAKRSLGIKGA